MAEQKANAEKAAPKRKKVESTFADKWEPQNPGDELAGRYLGYEEASGRDGVFLAHQVLDDNGKRWSCSGAYLDSFLKQVPQGAFIWITFDGKRRLKNGDMHLYKVDVEEGVQLKSVLKS